MSEDLLKQAKDEIKGYQAQLEAVKHMLNESMGTQLQLRSSLIIFQQANQEYLIQSQNDQKEIAHLKQQLIDFGNKILELSPSEPEVAAQPDLLVVNE